MFLTTFLTMLYLFLIFCHGSSPVRDLVHSKSFDEAYANLLGAANFVEDEIEEQSNPQDAVPNNKSMIRRSKDYNTPMNARQKTRQQQRQHWHAAPMINSSQEMKNTSTAPDTVVAVYHQQSSYYYNPVNPSSDSSTAAVTGNHVQLQQAASSHYYYRPQSVVTSWSVRRKQNSIPPPPRVNNDDVVDYRPRPLVDSYTGWQLYYANSGFEY
jgi:hypothetical protein